MADNKNYYYIRLKDNFFEQEAIQILEAMPDGYLYCNILLKMYLKSLKFDGRLMYNERIPYNATVLATLTRHHVGTVEKALEVLQQLDLIDVLDNGAIYMLDIQKYIGKSTTEADRKREYRARIESEKVQLLGQMDGQMSDISTPENRDKENRDKRIDYQRIAAMYNDTCVSFPRLKALSDARKKAIKARLQTYTYEDFQTLFTKADAINFLKGKNDRNWSASFDWLIKDANMAKVLDGNYDNKGQAAPPKDDHRQKQLDAYMQQNEQANTQPVEMDDDIF